MPLAGHLSTLHLWTARFQDRAVSIWGVCVVSLSASTLTSTNETAFFLACAALLLAPLHMPRRNRAVLAFTSISAWLFGAPLLVVGASLALCLAGFMREGIVAALILTATALGSLHLQSLPSHVDFPVHAGSLASLALPSLVTGLILCRWFWLRGIATLVSVVLLVLLLLLIGTDAWFGAQTISDEIARTFIATLPALAAGFNASPREETFDIKFLLSCFAVGFSSSFLMPSAPLSAILFDESHGNWETTRASFGPDSFGRSANYTYSLLFNYAGSVVGRAATLDSETSELPPRGSAVVVKMPSNQLSEHFIQRLTSWVSDGGRLIVVADHTDLYDSTQNLNELLSRLGYVINADAVFDAAGMPNTPSTGRGAVCLGRIDAFGVSVPWQTGADLGRMPANAFMLATFGPSFAERGDYSHPNRFGPFQPHPSKRFLEHTAIAASAFGKGAIAVILDSTPWSNFAIFREQYPHLFRGLVHVLERPWHMRVVGWSYLALVTCAIALLCVPSQAIQCISGLTFGLAIGAATQLGMTSLEEAVPNRDFKVRVIAGHAAKFEFLKQLVEPGERNYSRVVSSMAKYQLMPMASLPGTDFLLSSAKRWLLIEPGERQLPSPSEVLSHLSGGGDIAILFSTEDATRPDVKRWLRGLGLFLSRSTALAVAEDSRPGGFTARRGAQMLRDIRSSARAGPASILKEFQSDSLISSFTVRPTKFPRSSGILSISFSADQFSDDAVGEVWEGIEPSGLGRHRERQLAAVLMGEELLPPMPDNIILPAPQPVHTLPSYVLFEDGRKILEGKLPAPLRSLPPVRPPSFSENPEAYLADLQASALEAIRTSCTAPSVECPSHLLGSDMVEWSMKWSAAPDGAPTLIELLHERRHSSIGSTWNVVFGNK